MNERRYTLAEIDRMRRYFRSCTQVVMVDPTEGFDVWDECMDMSMYPVTVNISDAEAEMRLRTAMLANVDPDEIPEPASREPE